MKKILFVLVVLVLFGCVSVPNGKNQAKTTIKIENIGSMSRAGIWLFEELPVGSTNTALGSNIISENILTVGLTFPDKTKGNTWQSNKRWQGEGDFYIAIVPIVENSYQQPIIYVGNGNKPIKYSFRNTELVTLSFSEFRSYSYSEYFYDIVTDEEKLTSIQGSWKHTNPKAQGATYTFSGDKFTFTRTDGRQPISGTVKIADNKLCLIVSDERFGLKYLDILPDDKIYLNELFSNVDLSYGPFKKQ